RLDSSSDRWVSRCKYPGPSARVLSLVKLLALLAAALFLLPNCRLRMEGYEEDFIETTVPAEPNSVLPSGTFPEIHFRTELDPAAAEALFSLSCCSGTVSGSCTWSNQRLIFNPDSPLSPGVKYRMNFTGMVPDRQGRRYPVVFSLPFYYAAVSPTAAVFREESPPSGSRLDSPDASIRIEFSSPADPAEVEEAVRIDPNVSLHCEWDAGNRSCIITPSDAWENKRLYTLYSDDGTIPILYYRSEYEEPPPPMGTPSTVKMDLSGGFPPSGKEFGVIASDETFQLSFNRPIVRDEFEDACSLEPYCSLSWYWKDDQTAVCIPDRGFTPGTEYECRVDPDAASLPPDLLFVTVPSIPQVMRVEGHSGDCFPEDLAPLPEESILITPAGTNGTYSFSFIYPEPIEDPQHRYKAQCRCRLSPLFPPDIASPEIVSFTWTDNSCLMVHFQHIGLLHGDRTCYYRLSLPDGTGDRNITLRYEP
ncbi:MAG: Ig-like domain-containing protein, partial [Sediminispirochaetaceae bacterium]